MTGQQIAGALADGGRGLEEVTAIANDVATSIATMSVSLSPCSVPGQQPSFHLEQDEMELGLGHYITLCQIKSTVPNYFYIMYLWSNAL